MEPFDRARCFSSLRFIVKKQDEKGAQITPNLSFYFSAGSNYEVIWENQIMLCTQGMI